jgi:hypothetical protein
MEYATRLNGVICDNNYLRHVGWKENNPCIQKYYSQETVDIISYKVTELLQGVDPQNRPIQVPDDKICHVMSQIYSSFRPPTGDIYGRYNIPNDQTGSYIQSMIDQTIEVIVSNVRNTLGMEEHNKNLTIWTTVLGDFNRFGLGSHAPIKVQNKHPQFMAFNMNY